jgi:hypothetical protein
MTPRKVKTAYDPPPIPTRNHDWSATFEDYDLGDPIGWGPTEKDALMDFEWQIDGDDDQLRYEVETGQ